MKINPVYTILLIIILLLACDENFVIVKCGDCLESEPIEATVLLEVDYGGGIAGEVKIYEGNIENNILTTSSIIYSKKMIFQLEINKKYTINVEYTVSGGARYSAINSVYPRVKLELEQCSVSPCFYVYDDKLNMELKYFR
jgi:hypothetical protein